MSDVCQVCGVKQSYSLMRCSVCRKTFCDSCGVRRGGAMFCGDLCAHAFYFGEGDEDEEVPEDEASE